ncbi:PAS domain-containing protein [Mucilaginibacter lacusdianchii]|uniref:PAS domain-containing protein n=1 Tax=Mucilaginibacter lacusdianchii TaxID=2684211 RepID=UPI00131A6C0D|nr:PAS domain-containing protein [Mucilaginibacter sp. JXJ CY 39]
MVTEILYSLKQYQTMYDSLTDGVLLSDAQGKCLYINPSFTELFNVDSLNVIGKSVNCCLECIRLPLVYKSYQQAVKEQCKQTETYAHEVTQALYKVTVVPVDDYFVTLFVRSHIVENKSYQNLTDSHGFLEGVFNAPNVGLIVYQAVRNTDGKIVDFTHLLISKKTEEMLRQTNLSGKTMAALLKNYCERQFNSLCQVVNTGELRNYELDYKTLEGDRWLQISNAKYKDGVIHVWDDITNRKIAEQESLRAKNLLEAIFNTSNTGLSVMQSVRDDQGQIVDFIYSWNNKVITNMAGADITGRRMLETFPSAKDLGIFDEYVQAVTVSGFADIERSFKASGIDGWFRWTAVKLDDGLFVTVENITERKKKEENKLRDQAILQQSEQLAQLGSWDYDMQTGVYRWSEGMYSLFDLKAGTPVTPEIYLAFATISCKPIAKRIVDAIRSGYSPFEETLDIVANAQIKTIKVRGQIIRSATDDLLQVVGVDWNITHTRQAEARIKENADLIRGIADAAPDMLYVIDLRTMRMVYANGNTTRMFNKTVEQIRALGMLFFDAVIHPDDKEKFKNNIEQLRNADSHEVNELIYRIFDSRGDIHWVKTRRTVYKRNKTGLATHVIGVSQDITPQVLLHEQNKQLEERKQKEILTAVLSAQEEERKRIAESLHNGLGQLLYGVKMNLEQVNLTKYGVDIEEIQSARQLTGQLLSAAIKECRRISHELTPSILEDFGLRYAIQDVCQQFGRTMHTQCHFEGMYYKVEPYLEIAIYRIVQELVLNVIKHAQADRVDVTLIYKRKSIIITVKDDGVGFDSKEEQKQGIGLKTIRNKIKLLKGNMVVASAQHQGTTFNITIPIKN